MEVLGCGFKTVLTAIEGADRRTIQNSLLPVHQPMDGSNNEGSINNEEKCSMEKSMAEELRNEMFLEVPS